MDLFKLMASEDRRNKTCKSAPKRKIGVQTAGALQLSLKFSEEDDESNTSLDTQSAVSLRQVLDRKLTLYKMLYPFLPLEQVQGKVLQSLGLPPKGFKEKNSCKLISNSQLKLSPLMMNDYHLYHVQVLTSLNHTNGALKVAYELSSSTYNQKLSLTLAGQTPQPLAKVQEIAPKNFDETITNGAPSEAAFSLPSIMPLGKRDPNIQQPVKSMLPPLKRSSMFTVASVAGTSDKVHSEKDSIIIAKKRKVGLKIVCSTPLKQKGWQRPATPSESSLGTIENVMLPPTPPRKSLPRMVKASPVRTPYLSQNELRPKIRPGTPLLKPAPLKEKQYCGSEVSLEDSIVGATMKNDFSKEKLGLKIFTNRDGFQKVNPPISEMNLTSHTEPPSHTIDAFQFPETEDNDQLGLPTSDYLSKVKDFLAKSANHSFSEASEIND